MLYPGPTLNVSPGRSLSDARLTVEYPATVRLFRVLFVIANCSPLSAPLKTVSFCPDQIPGCQTTLAASIEFPLLFRTVPKAAFHPLICASVSSASSRIPEIVKYFENALENARENLNGAENELLQFSKSSNIINYYEQSKAVAVVKEDMEVEFKKSMADLAGLQAGTIKLEEKLHEIKDKIRRFFRSIH